MILLGTAGLVLLLSWPPINRVETGQTPEYPDIQPLVLRYSPSLVVARIGEAVEQLDGWTLVAVDPDAGLITAEHTSGVFGFTDDVEVTVDPFGSGSIVNMCSTSRRGHGDFGQNARNIESLQAALQAALSLARQAD